jgi:hypothetical protein
LIGKRALDDLPIDTPRTALGFAFCRWRRRDLFVAAIDNRFEGIELRRWLVIASIAASAVGPFTKGGLTARAAPRASIAIAPLAVARRLPLARSLALAWRLAFTRRALPTLAARLTATSLTLATALAALALTPLIAPAALAGFAIAIARRTTPTWTTLAALLLLLLRALAGLRRCAFASRSRTVGACAPATTTAARTIAGR